MCLTPHTIDNPNYNNIVIRKNSPWIDTYSQKLAINCGHCSECIAVKQMQLVQRVLMESIENHIFFTTITYNEDMIPRYTTSTGYEIKYVDQQDLHMLYRKIRDEKPLGNRQIRYFTVIELGTKRGRPHVHILWTVQKKKEDDYNDCLNMEHNLYNSILANWTRNIGTKRRPIYKPLLTLVKKYKNGKLHSTYDTHYCNPILSKNDVADVAFYVLKYMIKPSTKEQRLQQALRLNLDEHEYEEVWKTVRPHYNASLKFGLAPDENNKPSQKIIEHLKKGIEYGKGKFDYPIFINPITGQTFPLAKFYKKFGYIYSFKDATDIYYEYEGKERELKTGDQKWKAIHRYEKIADTVNNKDIYENFEKI